MKKATILCIVVVLLLDIIGFAAYAHPAGRRLRQIVSDKYPDGNVYIGAAVSYHTLKGTVDSVLNSEFNYLTPENDFKQNYIHPQPGKWNWKAPDGWVEYAKKHKQVIRIHGPISPQCSRWAKDDSRTAKELEKNLREYMTALCERYNGKENVRWMDVVNETVGNSGDWLRPLPGNDQWENPWPKIGYQKNIPARFKSIQDGVPLYIIQAFKIANAKAPDIKLVINQHGNLDDKIWRRVKDLVLYLRLLGLRVDGIGWQGHIRVANARDWAMDSENIGYLSSLIDWAHANDLEFHVTENNIFDKIGAPDIQNQYSAILGNILKTLLSQKDTGVVTWNIWGLEDRMHYKNKSLMIRGLWDENFEPKKSYYKVQRVLESASDGTVK